MKRRLFTKPLVLVLVMAMFMTLSVPVSAAKVDVTGMPGHEVLAKLPETLQRPARPTTLEQAEGRVGDLMITRRLVEEKKADFRRNYGSWYGNELEEEIMNQFSGGIYSIRWTLPQSKENVFLEIVGLTDSLTAGKASDTEKVRAIFDWVSQNVRYDNTALSYHNKQEAGIMLTEAEKKRIDESADPFYAYAQKLAICDGYADLCFLMCTIAEIPVVNISGISNERGVSGGGPHAWNAALADGRWLFFDSTWKQWDMAPNYHKSSNVIFYCDGVFQVTDSYEEHSMSYWLCPGFECPENVVIPEGCSRVMAESFKYCTTLKSITLPSTCSKIGTEAFKGCTGLTGIIIPAGVVEIDWRAFQDCTSLTNVKFVNKTVDIWEDAFDGTPLIQPQGFSIVDGILLKYKGYKEREVVIPSGVVNIAQKAFSFYDKTMLNKVVIPEGVVVIGGSAFSNFRFLREVNIPSSVMIIGENAFLNTAWSNNQGNSTGSQDWVIVNGILLEYKGPNVESVTVPDGVVEIAQRALYYNGSNIRKITFPASLKKINPWMLSHSYLQEVTFKGTKAQWDAVEILRAGGTNWVMRDPDSTCVIHTATP